MQKKISLWVCFAERTDAWWRKMLGTDVTDNYCCKSIAMNKEDDSCIFSKTLSEVCKAVNEILGPRYLYLPRHIEEDK